MCQRPVHGCGRKVRNPNLDLGCAEWCKYADECLEDFKKPPPQTDSHPDP